MKNILFLSLLFLTGFIFAQDITSSDKPNHNDTTIVNNISIEETNKLLIGGVLENKADIIIIIAKEYQISPHFIIGIIGQESNYGKSNLARTKNNFGGLRNKTFISFDTPEEGLKALAINIKRHYHDRGLISVHEISGKWVHGNTKKTDQKWSAAVKSIGNKIHLKSLIE